MEFSYIRHRCPAFGIITLKESSNEGKILGHNDERKRDNFSSIQKRRYYKIFIEGRSIPPISNLDNIFLHKLTAYQ